MRSLSCLSSRVARVVRPFDRLPAALVHGRRINVKRSFKEGLIKLQREFNTATRKLVRHLDAFYDLVGIEFESRFAPRIRAATHGLNAGGRAREVSNK